MFDLIYSRLGSGLYAVRLEDGDDIMAGLRRFLEVKKVRAGLVEGIGSLKRARLGYFDFEKTRRYRWRVFSEDMEILALTGNVSVKDDGRILPHVHVSLGRSNFTVLGGHLDEGSIANMVEVFVTQLPSKLVKKHHPEIGLNLLELENRLKVPRTA